MTFKASLHNHSLYSDASCREACKDTTPQKILETCFKKDIQGIAVTDADSDIFFQRIFENPKKFFGDKYEAQILYGGNVGLITNQQTGKKVYIYNGIEMHEKTPGHILVIGYSGSLMFKYQKLNLQERLMLAQESEGIVIAPHPLCKLAGGIDEENLRRYQSLIDAIEGHNAQLIPPLNKANKSAKKLGKELNLPVINSADSKYGEADLGYFSLYDFPKEKEINDGKIHITKMKKQIKEKKFSNSQEKYLKLKDFLKIYLLDLLIISKLKRLIKN